MNVRNPSRRLLVPLLAAMLGFGIGPASADDQPTPAPVDAARLNERYAIAPGTESLFAEMLGKGETLPGGCTLTDGKIQRTSVLATYTCGDAQVVLALLHPASAAPGGVHTDRFAVSVQSGTPPKGLVEAVGDRVRAREAAFQWVEVGDTRVAGETARTRTSERLLMGAGAVVLAIVLFWALRRRAD